MSLTVYPDPATGGGAAIGDTVTGATAGSVFFAGALGVLAQNNAAFQWIDADTQLQLTAGAATKTPLEINLFAAQSADAFQVKNSSSAVVAAITKDGYLQMQNRNVLSSSGAGRVDVGASTGANTDLYLNYVSTGKIYGLAGASTFVTEIDGNGINVPLAAQFGFANVAYVAPDTGLARSAAGIVKITNGSTGAGAMQLQEMTAPTAPATNNAIIFAEDNGSGKTRIVVRFPTGADVVLATEA